MNIFKMFKVVRSTKKQLDANDEYQKDLSSLEMPDFINEWFSVMSKTPDGTRPVLVKPASDTEIENYESRLAIKLPQELIDFYKVTNGIKWRNTTYENDIYSLNEIDFSLNEKTPLSQQLLNEWQEWGQEDGEPKLLRIFTDSIKDILIDKDQFQVPFEFIDDALSLYKSEEGKGAVIIVKENQYLPIGTVLSIENLHATIYPNLRYWLAFKATVINMLMGLSQK